MLDLALFYLAVALLVVEFTVVALIASGVMLGVILWVARLVTYTLPERNHS